MGNGEWGEAGLTVGNSDGNEGMETIRSVGEEFLY